MLTVLFCYVCWNEYILVFCDLRFSSTRTPSLGQVETSGVRAPAASSGAGRAGSLRRAAPAAARPAAPGGLTAPRNAGGVMRTGVFWYLQ